MSLEKNNCEKCRGTDCLVSDIATTKDGVEIFADLRFDLDFNQLDINFGVLGEDGFPKETFWGFGVDIKYCPFCGNELRTTSFVE